jgi:hypothetical protein
VMTETDSLRMRSDVIEAMEGATISLA